MPDPILIEAELRTVLGKKVKHLRRAGIVPANIYGRGLESTAIQLESRSFHRTLRAHGTRQMFRLHVQGEAQPRQVLLRAMVRTGGTGDVAHADFYQVDMAREVTTRVPVVLTGESAAVRDLSGTLIQNIDFVTVRCLPGAIPDAIEADLSVLVDFDASIRVGDLVAPEGVFIEDADDVNIAVVAPPRVLTEDEEEAEAAAEAAAEAGEPVEGEAEATDADESGESE